MKDDLKIQPSAVTNHPQKVDAECGSQNASKFEWHAPVITRIDIKRTMIGPGSNMDSDGGTP